MTAAVFGDTFGLDGGTRAASLVDKFVVPPFSILDTRQGYWQTRKRAWQALGIQSEIGRDGRAFNIGLQASVDNGWQLEDNKGSGTSLFDPVLCELMYRWFAPEGGTILDPFAGGSVRGIVAAHLGHPYIGIDLSARQIAANREQVALLAADRPVPEWIVGDSAEVLPTVPDGVDLVFSCPPYFDLEVYSDAPADLSAMTWAGFITAYEQIIKLAVAKLHRGRYAVFVVSEVRGTDGKYRGLVPTTIAAFERAGAAFYNELILVNSIGSLPIRITRQFEAQRKIGRTHQNVLVFVKGDAPRGWAYDRAAPADPQVELFAPMSAEVSAAIAPLPPPQPPTAPEPEWVCARCGLAVPAGPVIPVPGNPSAGRGLCWPCDDVTEWTA